MDELDSHTVDIEWAPETNTIMLRGSFLTTTVSGLSSKFSTIQKKIKNFDAIQLVDASELKKIDTAGAYFLDEILGFLKESNNNIQLKGFRSDINLLLEFIKSEASKVNLSEVKQQTKPLLHEIGLWAEEKFKQAILFFTFIGEFFLVLIKDIILPFSLSWTTVMENIDSTGFRALPIVGLMSFLIGIVLAYQLGDQLRAYGANIFVVDVTGIGILREFAPLITAIIMAGRTSTSFAAMIGSMKVNEEIDALGVMGIKPIRRLVVPRVIALIIVMPLLIVWADIFGILGSMIMAKHSLGISYAVFVDRLKNDVPVVHYLLGVIKAPAFALAIGTVGCFQGLSVANSAVSVGAKTTKAAVQAIFLIIILDALFSILFSWMDL